MIRLKLCFKTVLHINFEVSHILQFLLVKTNHLGGKSTSEEEFPLSHDCLIVSVEPLCSGHKKFWSTFAVIKKFSPFSMDPNLNICLYMEVFSIVSFFGEFVKRGSIVAIQVCHHYIIASGTNSCLIFV